MNPKLKRSMSEYVVGIGLMLFYSFGVLMFIVAVGFEGAMKTVALVVGALGLFGVMIKFVPMLAYYAFIAALGFVVIYGLGGWELIRYALAVPVVGLFYWAVYTFGNRFGWWNKSHPHE